VDHPSATPKATTRKSYKIPRLRPTPHTQPVRDMIARLAGPWRAAVEAPLFARTASGDLPPVEAWRQALLEFFTIVECFPKYMGLSLAKTTYGKRPGDQSVRRWLLQNIGIEARHTEWYIDWMASVGLTPDDAIGVRPCEEIRELHDHLMKHCAGGSLAEGIAAANWAIEGITGEWSQNVAGPFRGYAELGARIDCHTMLWLEAHARYDDAHPEEALEIVKLGIDVDDDCLGRAEAAARKSLDLFTRAISRCFPA
jgi:pyrroloquinoline quinone (PQQ) biosynthesis protein C